MKIVTVISIKIAFICTLLYSVLMILCNSLYDLLTLTNADNSIFYEERLIPSVFAEISLIILIRNNCISVIKNISSFNKTSLDD